MYIFTVQYTHFTESQFVYSINNNNNNNNCGETHWTATTTKKYYQKSIGPI